MRSSCPQELRPRSGARRSPAATGQIIQFRMQTKTLLRNAVRAAPQGPRACGGAPARPALLVSGQPVIMRRSSRSHRLRGLLDAGGGATPAAQGA